MKIDIGCGDRKRPGYIGLDVANVPGVDVVYDLEKGLPYHDNSVDEIFCSHFLEHVKDPMKLINEVYRILKPGGIFEVVVPHFSNYNSYTFLHLTYYNVRNFDILDMSKCKLYHYGYNINFKILVKVIEFSMKMEYKPTFIEKLMMYKDGGVFEKWISQLFRATQIRVIMQKV